MLSKSQLFSVRRFTSWDGGPGSSPAVQAAGQAGQLSPRTQVGPFSLPHPGAEVLKVSGVAAGRLVASGAAWGQGCWEGKEN